MKRGIGRLSKRFSIENWYLEEILIIYIILESDWFFGVFVIFDWLEEWIVVIWLFMIMLKFILVIKFFIEFKDCEIFWLNFFIVLDFEGGFLEIGDFLDISIMFGLIFDRVVFVVVFLFLICFVWVEWIVDNKM